MRISFSDHFFCLHVFLSGIKPGCLFGRLRSFLPRRNYVLKGLQGILCFVSHLEHHLWVLSQYVFVEVYCRGAEGICLIFGDIGIRTGDTVQVALCPKHLILVIICNDFIKVHLAVGSVQNTHLFPWTRLSLYLV